MQTITDWDSIQSDLRANVYGDWQTIRHCLSAIGARLNPDDGIGSSDINHMAYAWVRSGADYQELVAEAQS